MYLANVSFKCISPNELQCKLICQLGGNSQSLQPQPLLSPLPLHAEPACQSVIKCVARLLLRVFIASCRAQMKQIQRQSHRYRYSDSCRYRYRYTVPMLATATVTPNAAASHAAHQTTLDEKDKSNNGTALPLPSPPHSLPFLIILLCPLSMVHSPLLCFPFFFC